MTAIRSLIAILFLALPVAATAQAGTAQDRIEQLVTVLRDVMQPGPEISFQDRAARFEAPVLAAFDFPTIARVGLQRNWPQIPEQDRGRIVAAVTRLSIATFASRFKANAQVSLEVRPEQAGPRGLALVPMVIHRPDAEPVTLTYVLRESDAGQPRVIDILTQGRYSELARQRAEMSSVFAEGGAEAVVRALNSKADDLARQ